MQCCGCVMFLFTEKEKRKRDRVKRERREGGGWVERVFIGFQWFCVTSNRK